jgi:hypothetical protein
MHLPSAGMIRFRFNGSAFASQPVARHPEVSPNIGAGAAGARGVKAGRCSLRRFPLLAKAKAPESAHVL